MVTGRGAPKLMLDDTRLEGGDRLRTVALPAAAKPYWIRINVRDKSDTLTILSNPIYIEPKSKLTVIKHTN